MQPLRVFSVIQKLPPKLEPLWELAYNSWFSWNSDIEDMFAQIDQRLWRECYKNPVIFLNKAPKRLLEEMAEDEIYLQRLKEAHDSLKHYLAKKKSSLPFKEGTPKAPVVVYFSLEYGICLSLPIYSGGLGMLAGDHLKSASDLNAPLVGIGLCYQEGYFRQYLTQDGWQQERYQINDFEQMPLTLCQHEDGAPIMICLDLAGQPLHAQIWKTQVGRITLYLLDTNVQENPPHLQQITARLYGGDLEMRVWQEILLGVGGIKALQALSLEPKVIHMNEGHSAFAGLERIRRYMQEENLSFEAAMELVASTSVFTTHTPVPAGNDRFPPDLMQRYFEGYARDLGLAFKVLLALGREDPRDDNEHFCMTVLALKLSRFNNGVSQLHGHVSRNMWQRVWPQYPVEDVPIGAITNGVHTSSWLAPDIALLYDRYIGPNWREDPDCSRAWAAADTISEAELWRTHERLRARLVDFVRMRLYNQLNAKGVRQKALEMASEVLDPQALTIGFARRFATYKRANMLLMDRDRLKRIISNKERPVQFIFAGKAHPKDNEGKKLIQELIDFCREDDHRFKVVFIEDYDMEIAQYMVQGCDIWMNNPRRPLEACGTSGMKAVVNGVIHMSTLDGWWDEAYLPDNSVGFAIGRGEEYEDLAYQDFVESQTLYNILENDVIPDFYDRGHGGLPRGWIRRMKKVIMELIPKFSSHRMVEDYSRTAYLPALNNYNRLQENNYEPAKELASWRMDIMTKWGQVRTRDLRIQESKELSVGDAVSVELDVHLQDISPEHLLVEVYAGPLNEKGDFMQRKTYRMQPQGDVRDGWQRFVGSAEPADAGRFGLTVRILPAHPLLLDPHSLGLIHWAQP